ncbi:GNAT family N-acetyltransferase [Roseovarius gahaiensis]|uniref:GNAT family N-acetyltransferase n=1 Tax=Roseovarius gahaiensis TaxID=2716691 RepID=A0A967EFW2_9RHOB|nr:GNAT family N-acetyltransferase [Roseovarius gahaiensis]NHQ73925.1 GNAT family N-acetyltransferase [Roseovarius gahaiensis]
MDRQLTKEIEVRRYTPGDRKAWDTRIQNSCNGTFIHQRAFMEYHSDRFVDHSLIIEDGDKILGLLPANRADTTLYSHQGLTYGGLIIDEKTSASAVLSAFDALRTHLKKSGITALVYKPTPHIFHKQPAESDIFALTKLGAKLEFCDLASVIAVQSRIPFNKLRKRSVNKAKKNGLITKETQDYTSFWGILSESLGERHNVRPTHSLEEILLLRELFPNQVRLFASFQEGRMLAGTLIFDMCDKAHLQYIATSETGRQVGALDIIIDQLLEKEFADYNWLSFGISTTHRGNELNTGLLRQKEMFGGRSIIFPHFRWEFE